MKKLFCSLFLIGVTGMMTVSAGNIKVEHVAERYAQCVPAQSKDVYYYIPNDTVKYWPWDNITARDPAILVASKTRVDIWNPNSVISNCGDWSTIGNITPGAKQKNLALHNFDGCTFSKPNYNKALDPNKLDAQLHYSVAFWTLNETSPNKATASFAYTTKDKFDQSPREYTCYPSGQKVAKPADCPKATLRYQKVNGDAEYHNGECLNYRVFWCGDGLVNRPDGSTEYNNGTANEQCDPNDPNKAGWADGSGKTCTIACKLQDIPRYDLAIEKTISTTTPAPYQPGSTVTFDIKVINQGNQSATNVVVTDYLPPALELIDANWKTDGANKVVQTIPRTLNPGASITLTITTKIRENFRGERIINLAEITSDDGDDIDSTPGNCNPTGQENLQTCTTNEDDNAQVELPLTPVNYDLALTKTIANKKASYKAGDELEFIFTIYNQGNKEAKNIEVTDYFPSDLELLDTTWTLLGDKASKTLTETIAPGANKTLTMKVRIKADFKGTKIVNKAEISKDNSGDYNTTDKDSTPNANPSDDCYSGDDKHIITGNGKTATAGNCTDTTDEDDHDGVSIAIDARPEIKKNLTGDPNHHYKIGELVGFKMPFKNTTANTLLKVSIKDFLPLNLEYVSSEIHGVSPVLSGLSLRQGVTVLEYSGFNLSPNQEGYLLFTGRVKADHLTERINTVGIYVNDLLVESDTETYKVIHPNLMIEKLVDKKVVNSGDVVTFTLNIRALSGVFDELKVIDTLPKGLVYVENTQKLTNSTTNTTITDFSVVKNTSNLDTLNWKLAFADKIKAGQSFQLQFQARLVEASNGKYTNTACVEDPKTSHDPICDTEDVTPRDPKGDLSIKKYVNKVSADAGREDILMEGFTK